MEAEKPILVSKRPVADRIVAPIMCGIMGCIFIYLSVVDDRGSLFMGICGGIAFIVIPFAIRGDAMEVYKDRLIIKGKFNSVTLPLDNITSWEEMSGFGQKSPKTILYTKNMPRDSYAFSVGQFENYKELKEILTKNKPIEPEDAE